MLLVSERGAAPSRVVALIEAASEIDGDALALPIAEAGGLEAGRAALFLFGRALGGGRSAFGGFGQGAARGVAERLVGLGVGSGLGHG